MSKEPENQVEEKEREKDPAKIARDLRYTGATLSPNQMLTLTNLGKCFNSCGVFPYFKNLNKEVKDTVINIKHAIGKENEKELISELELKMKEIMDLIGKIK